LNPLAEATFAYLYFTTPQNTDQPKRGDVDIRPVWEHEWDVMARSDGELPEL